MHVSLTPELETLVKNHVKTGRYHSSSEVIREALRVWEEQEQMRDSAGISYKRIFKPGSKVETPLR